MCSVECLISKQGSIKPNFGAHDDDDMGDNGDDDDNEGNVDDDGGCALCKLNVMAQNRPGLHLVWV